MYYLRRGLLVSGLLCSLIQVLFFLSGFRSGDPLDLHSREYLGFEPRIKSESADTADDANGVFQNTLELRDPSDESDDSGRAFDGKYRR